jgi:hypothetical protein
MARIGLRRGLLACALVILAAVLSLAPYLTDSAQLVRMRNALLIDFDAPARFDWTPATMPADYAVEREAAEPPTTGNAPWRSRATCWKGARPARARASSRTWSRPTASSATPSRATAPTSPTCSRPWRWPRG